MRPDPATATATARADELLVLRCQLGERAAFEPLVMRWAGPLRRHVLRVTGDPEAADELTQDIWLRVVQGIGRLRQPEQFRSWLFGIAHRVLMDRFRQHYASRHDAADVFDQMAEPGDGAGRLEATLDVERHLHRLPMVEREVITLFHLDELPLADVAQALGVPVGTVKSRLFRARQLLRQSLTQEETLP
ncbi:RNA polymerase sigma factor [Arenimonas sp. MALMAid1274]|uniref:RNA polymerase sigma factor n=1 Tax=Arenimonas sp. MALMAid1274 TaxID=3411630 RepID=UPI003B9DE66B